jgi:hypothetical protein
MASPKNILTIAIGRIKDEKSNNEDAEKESPICELVERVFTTRNLVHFAHWSTGSFASHMALGELYDAIVDLVDDIVETYQGEFGLLSGLETECAKSTDDILPIIKADADWLKANRTAIANGSRTIENMLDGLTGCYNKIIYKLTNLK